MPTTTNMGLPYPAPSDAPDGPGAIYALAQKLDQLGAAWTPTIDGVSNSTEVQGRYMRVGGYCIAHGFVRLADGNTPSSASNYLNLPIPTAQLAGIPYSIGTVDITKRSTFVEAFGRVVASTSFSANNSKALIYVDNVPSTGGMIGSSLFTGQAPLNIASGDAVYFNFRLLYWVGI